MAFTRAAQAPQSPDDDDSGDMQGDQGDTPSSPYMIPIPEGFQVPDGMDPGRKFDVTMKVELSADGQSLKIDEIEGVPTDASESEDTQEQEEPAKRIRATKVRVDLRMTRAGTRVKDELRNHSSRHPGWISPRKAHSWLSVGP